MQSLYKEKIQQAVQILKELNIDMWLTYVRETETIRDPSLDLILGTNCTWQSAFIITKNGETIAIVGSLDVANIKSKNLFDEVIGYVQGIKDDLLKVLAKLNPQKIAINFSKSSNLADGLTHGMYLDLIEKLNGTQFIDRLISSEEIISLLRGRKSATEIELMKKAIKITLEILDLTGKFIKPGVSEKEIAEFILNEVKKRGLETAWDKEYCPSVFTGPDTAGAHAGPTDRLVQKGHVLNIDFGVKYNGYCSDLQRTWYILRDDENDAPPEVKKGFQVIVDSIQKAAEFMKPGSIAYEVDAVARNHIVENGYEEYPHALGHQVGRKAHDGGVILAPRWERYGDIPYKKIGIDEVYTLEPRLTIPNYGIATVEEEVVVRENGVEFLSEPQREIYLIRS
ncbi:MAG: Xaa-Pro peptidase family protein [Ignavibacteria bacterium]|jgi:Xaa-Pro aminopeptidase|nr:Xaa-Pro peptidase family protein [Ignavibacteria bacterium]MDH7526788.1 Xaa-Pro peptidase family protein [Ignavibacteria bacterium]